MNLKNKVVIITGSSSGIGRSTALLFAKEGAKVVVTYKSNENRAKEIQKELIKQKADYLLFKGDLSEPKAVKELFKMTINTFKSIDILVNNAGFVDPLPLEKTTKEYWLHVFDDNLFSTVLCCKEAIPYMEKQKMCKIINIASIRGIKGRHGNIAYAAAKAGVINFTQTLACQLVPKILVNSVSPGVTNTAFYDDYDKETIEKLLHENLIDRMIDPTEIAETILFIAKNDAMTGENVVVDGGLLLR